MPRAANPLPVGQIHCCDCITLLQQLPDGCIDLVYIDPPFFCSTDKRFGVNPWNTRGEYLGWLSVRLVEMQRVLVSTGSIFVHLDWHVCHYVKCMMDSVFGETNFVNEIIWYYYNKLGSRRNRVLPRAHDTILRYSKTESRFTYNLLTEPRDAPAKMLVTHQKDGKIQNVKDENGHCMYTIREDRGIDDVWRIRCLQPANKKEVTGYPTQKPRDLLERIVKLSTNRGDLVADFFCGSGTTLMAARRLGRRWIGCDISKDACRVSKLRMQGSF